MVFGSLWFCIVLASGSIGGAIAFFCNVNTGPCTEHVLHRSIRNTFLSWQQFGTSRRPQEVRGNMYSHATLFERIRTNLLHFIWASAAALVACAFAAVVFVGLASIVGVYNLQPVFYYSSPLPLNRPLRSIALRPVSPALVDRVWVGL